MYGPLAEHGRHLLAGFDKPALEAMLHNLQAMRTLTDDQRERLRDGGAR